MGASLTLRADWYRMCLAKFISELPINFTGRAIMGSGAPGAGKIGPWTRWKWSSFCGTQQSADQKVERINFTDLFLFLSKLDLCASRWKCSKTQIGWGGLCKTFKDHVTYTTHMRRQNRPTYKFQNYKKSSTTFPYTELVMSKMLGITNQYT